MNIIIEYALYLSVPFSFFSFLQMYAYLNKYGVYKYKMYGVRVDLVVINYIEVTLNKLGYIGAWFWLMIISIFMSIILSFVSVFIL